MTIERFPLLDSVPGLRAGFVPKIPGADVNGSRDEVLARLWTRHRTIADEEGFRGMPFALAEQVHGNSVEIVNPQSHFPVPGADGLITANRGLCLAIYVADCAAVFLADKHLRAIALVHSGRKGTELGIVRNAVRNMESSFQIPPGDLLAVVSPCIRPPHYEIDFAADIRRQLSEEGIRDLFDEGICTAANDSRYYSYRREKGNTGRMLALLAIDP